MAKYESQASDAKVTADKFKWMFALLLLGIGIVANYHFATVSVVIRFALGLVVFAVATALVLWTASGKSFLAFAAEARVELQKVVWPTRKETVQTTLIVAAMVVIVALLLWGVDSSLLWLIGLLTGARG